VGWMTRVPFSAEVEFFSSLSRPDQFWAALNLLFTDYWGLFPGGKVTRASS